MIKLKYILTTFILLFSITINGQGIYCTSNSQYKTYGGRVTSAYNNGTYNSVNKNSNVMCSGSNIGYSTVNFGYRTISSSYNTYNTINMYQPGVTKPDPRRSPQKPDPDNDWRDWWRMNMPNILGGNSDWPNYVDEEYWEEFISQYPEYKDEARKWFENHNRRFPGDPDDPFLTPVGEFPIGLLLLLMFGYLFYKINNKKTKKL